MTLEAKSPLIASSKEPKAPSSEPAVLSCDEAMRTRRSVRRFTSDPIDESVMRKCIDLALLAPNSSNLQPWEFHWVRSPEKKKLLVEACLNQSAAATARELVVCVARTRTWKRNAKFVLRNLEETGAPKNAFAYYQKLVPFVYEVGPFGLLSPFKSLLVMALSAIRKLPAIPVTEGDLRTWAIKSTALACENLMVALRAHGFDSCPMEGFSDRHVRKLLSLPRDASVVMVIAAGKRDEAGIWGSQFRIARELVAFEH